MKMALFELTFHPGGRGLEIASSVGLNSAGSAETIKRISKFLSDNGVITRDVSSEVADNYDYDFLAKATGKSPEQLGLKQ